MSVPDEISKAVNRFGEIAECFCSLVDSAGGLDRTEFLARVYRMIPELIQEAIRLPEVRFDDDEENEIDWQVIQSRTDADVPQKEWSRFFESLEQKLGDWNPYHQVFDPTTDKEAIYMSLSGDIAEIYRDLRDGINLRRVEGVPASEILFEWRNGFYSHWGRHAICALGTLHVLINDQPIGLNRPD